MVVDKICIFSAVSLALLICCIVLLLVSLMLLTDAVREYENSPLVAQIVNAYHLSSPTSSEVYAQQKTIHEFDEPLHSLSPWLNFGM